MSNRKAKIISRDAFAKAFVEAEIIMRRNLGTQINSLIDNNDNPDIIKGLELAKEIVVGKVVTNGS